MNDRCETILLVLAETKETGTITGVSDAARTLLIRHGARQEGDGSLVVSRQKRISLVIEAVSQGIDIESVVERTTWKDFEGLVARVLNENDYICVESFRKRGKDSSRGMEIDVIGVKGSTIVVIDAKMWGARRGKTSALMTAAERQKERTARLPSQMGKLSEKLGGFRSGTYRLIPVLVTWLIEEVVFHEGVPIVPIFELNSFLLDLSMYEDMLVSFDALV